MIIIYSGNFELQKNLILNKTEESDLINLKLINILNFGKKYNKSNQYKQI